MLMVIWSFLGNNAAEIIALCALVFTGYQVIASRRHNKLSVIPHLTTFTNRNISPNQTLINVLLLNNGLGPARILSYKVYLDDEYIKLSNSAETAGLLNRILPGKKFDHSVTLLTDKYMVPANEQKTLLAISFPYENEKESNEYEAALERLTLKIKYESIYGETFEFDSNDS